MRLSALAEGYEILGQDRDVSCVSDDSRRIIAGGLFVAVPGTQDDGHRYIADAVQRGAGTVVAERIDGVPESIARIRVPEARQALAGIAARFYGHPARELTLIGFTGTFGKTSTSDVLRALMAAAGTRVGVLGSLGARYDGFHQDTGGLTTPAPVELHRALRGLRDAGAETVIMEVTSHALLMKRAGGVRFAGGLLAAIQPGEHTDFHRTFDDYLEAKRLFLDYLAPDAMLAYDADNPAARGLAGTRPQGRAAGFSLEAASADLVFSEIRLDRSGARFRIAGPLVGEPRHISSALLGTGHLRNVALALTSALAGGIDPAVAAAVLETVQPLPRRMERYTVAGRTVLDDTAAHPQSFRAAFEVAALLRTGRLIVVYAVRGNRGAGINASNADALGALAIAHAADAFILTTSSEATTVTDRVAREELTAARAALSTRGIPFVFEEHLSDAAAAALDASGAGDLVMLLGAQGMNQGRAMLMAAARRGDAA